LGKVTIEEVLGRLKIIDRRTAREKTMKNAKEAYSSPA
jgi:hypothetical protein